MWPHNKKVNATAGEFIAKTGSTARGSALPER